MMLHYISLLCRPSPVFFLSYPLHSYTPSSTAAASHTPSRSMPACPHYQILTHAPVALPNPSHRSNSDCVVIYCMTRFWSRLPYSSIVSKSVASLAAATEVYFHVLSFALLDSCPVRRLAIWVWNSPRDVPVQGVTIQVSAPKSSTACITALKKKPGV